LLAACAGFSAAACLSLLADRRGRAGLIWLAVSLAFHIFYAFFMGLVDLNYPAKGAKLLGFQLKSPIAD